ncbi:MAG TPA: phosphoribulokinase [Thermodesulfobacteriota bacterium]|nr:phosphoribulokinase [Thermodesulfobacteriota bacterium]
MASGRRTMVAICGDSGTGKTTLSQGIVKLLGEERITTVCTDDYHCLDRRQRKALGVTALNPAANDIELLTEHARLLREGRTILKPVYDHRDGTIKGPELVTPKAIVFIQGLHALFTPAMRALFDLKIYLDPHPVLKRAWKIKRDVAKRGYTPEQVIEEIEARKPDAEAYIYPQKRYADIIVSFYPPEGSDGQDGRRLHARILTKRHLPPLDLSAIAGPENGRRDFWQHDDTLEDGTPVSVLEIMGDLPPERALALEERIWRHIGPGQQLAVDKLGQFLDGLTPAHSDSLGLVQLVLLWRILERVPPAARVGSEVWPGEVAGREAAAARG